MGFDLFDQLIMGLSVAVTAQNLFFCLLGCFIGTMIGVLPGIGPPGAIAMLLPTTFYLDPTGGLIMLAGIFYGASYGGSTTAILVNVPGESASIVTCLDGYQMAQKGRAGAALVVSALGSFFAGTVCTLLIAVAAPPLVGLALAFQAPEYFTLMLFGLVGCVVLARGSPVKAVAMTLLGLALGLIGTDVSSGTFRYTFGLPILTDGIGFVPVALGMLGVSEIIINLTQRQTKGAATSQIGRLWLTKREFQESWPAALRGTAVGAFLGVLPGGGQMLSSFASYTLEKKIAKDPSRFGRGAIEGVAGPEAANNAGAQTSFIPLLALGIPSGASMAMMIGAMTVHGIAPGPRVMVQQPELFWGIIASMWIGNAILLVINLPLIGMWVRLLSIPYRLLFPVILVICAVGSYALNSSTFEVGVVAAAAVIGYALRKVGCEPASMMLGFVLSQPMEQNLRRAMLLSQGDPTEFLRRPICVALLLASLGLILLIVMPRYRRTREVAFQE
jgi:putative tricarboxylic transport membrane protein